MDIKISAISAQLFKCEYCLVECSKKNDWDRHIITQKHVGNVSGNKKSARTIFECEICNKIYNSQKGLWGHRKKCGGINKTSGQITEKNNPVIDFLMKENAEFKNIIIEFIKTNKITEESPIIEFKIINEDYFIPYRYRVDKSYPNGEITMLNTFKNVKEAIQITDLNTTKSEGSAPAPEHRGATAATGDLASLAASLTANFASLST